MSKEKILFTSESVSEGHPDKVCDQISDSILDACLAIDENSHVACETFATDNFILIGGEITCKETPDFVSIAKDVLKRIGYDRPELGTDYHNVEVMVKVKNQSEDINMGVSQRKLEDLGAGDQGIMFGYATKETEGYMPLAISIAHKLMREATRLRKEGKFKGARPDMKSQVTIDYTDKNNIRIDTVLMSVQHDEDIDVDAFKDYIHKEIMQKVARSFGLNDDFRYFINPTGRFVIGGPKGDTGLTGRKIIVDTYGGYARHGGGAFSGKDCTKVDRSACYMARYIAKNIVASGLAEKCEIQLSYAIGVAEPTSIMVDTFGTAAADVDFEEIVRENFKLTPDGIIETLGLRDTTYKQTAKYGHLGIEGLPWEKTDKAEDLKKYIKN